ncbi:hypothetical protein MMPV_003206 [Pyropia vietnamensis]
MADGSQLTPARAAGQLLAVLAANEDRLASRPGSQIEAKLAEWTVLVRANTPSDATAAEVPREAAPSKAAGRFPVGNGGEPSANGGEDDGACTNGSERASKTGAPAARRTPSADGAGAM